MALFFSALGADVLYVCQHNDGLGCGRMKLLQYTPAATGDKATVVLASSDLTLTLRSVKDTKTCVSSPSNIPSQTASTSNVSRHSKDTSRSSTQLLSPSNGHPPTLRPVKWTPTTPTTRRKDTHHLCVPSKGHPSSPRSRRQAVVRLTTAATQVRSSGQLQSGADTHTSTWHCQLVPGGAGPHNWQVSTEHHKQD